jgi:hypothetical protein
MMTGRHRGWTGSNWTRLARFKHHGSILTLSLSLIPSLLIASVSCHLRPHRDDRRGPCPRNTAAGAYCQEQQPACVYSSVSQNGRLKLETNPVDRQTTFPVRILFASPCSPHHHHFSRRGLPIPRLDATMSDRKRLRVSSTQVVKVFLFGAASNPPKSCWTLLQHRTRIVSSKHTHARTHLRPRLADPLLRLPDARS